LEGAIRLEQHVRFFRFHVATPEFTSQFDEPQIARKPTIEAAESLEEHDPNRPRAKAPLSVEPVRGGVTFDAVEPFWIERRQNAYESRAASSAKTQATKLRWREAPELGCGRCGMEAVTDDGRCCPDHRPLDLARTAREDQLASEGPQQRLGDGVGAQRS
jgi:hypothetical protein